VNATDYDAVLCSFMNLLHFRSQMWLCYSSLARRARPTWYQWLAVDKESFYHPKEWTPSSTFRSLTF